MKFEFTTLYFAVDTTPDYSTALGFATSEEEAEEILLKNKAFNPQVIEIDLDRIIEKLLED